MDSSNHNHTTLSNFIKIQTLLSRANVILRNLFLERWAKYNGSEWDCTSVEVFRSSGIGKALLDKFQRLPIQKEAFESGDVNGWDLTILTDILIYTDFPSDSKQAKASEREKLKELKKIRNKLAHAPFLGVGTELFEEMWKMASDILISIGLIGCLQEDLDAIKFSSDLTAFQDENSSGHVNTANSTEAARLKTEANDLYKNGEFKKAVDIYSEAISLSGLLDSEMAILYSNRSIAYLSSAGKTNRQARSEELHCALQDGKEAVRLNPTWYRGYFRTANAYYELRKFKAALDYFDSALSFSPARDDLLLARDNCRMKLGQETRHEHMDPSGVPMSEAEQIKKLKLQLGGSATEELLANALDRAYNMIPGGAHVLRAHRTMSGTGETKDPEMAAKLYVKAASLGNPEAMYNLGLLYKDGNGVKQDFKMFIKLLRQAAAQPHRVPGTGIPNVGVAEAEYALGLANEEGLGVKQNFKEAAVWYQKSSDHGCGGGSNNLALLYMNGRGVPMNVEQAVQYWKLAAKRGETLAMRSLAIHYLKLEKDPRQAREWQERAINHGNLEAQLDVTEFEEKVKALEKENYAVVEDKLLKWEKESGITSNGMSLKNRLKRMEQTLNPIKRVTNSLTSALSSVDLNTGKEGSTPINATDLYKFDPVVLEIYARNGSKTATKIITAISHFKIFCDLLSQSDLRNTSEQIIHELARCYRIEQLVVQLTPAMKKQLCVLLTSALKSNATSELDKDARVCSGYLLADTLDRTFTFVDQSKRKYPNEKELHVSYLRLCGFLGKSGDGLQEAEKSLELFPKDVDLLYMKACFIRLLVPATATVERIISAHEEFLKVAPPDHSKVPEIYYTMACEYFYRYVERKSYRGRADDEKVTINGVAKMEEYYRLGLQAEQIQLPCFLPYECNQKTMIDSKEQLIKAVKSKFPKSKSNDKDDSNTSSEVQSLITPVVQSQPGPDYIMLSDRNRIMAIKSHRKYVLERRQILRSPGPAIVFPSLATKPVYTQRAPCQLIGLRPITFREMDTSRDRVYEGCVINVTSIDDVGFGIYPSILLLLEDENRDLLRCFIHDFPETNDESAQGKYGFEVKMSILNPYMRLAADGRVGIRVDDSASLFFHSQIGAAKRCRFCGSEADLRCKKCQRLYCSPKCQKMDWKLAMHNLICAPF